MAVDVLAGHATAAEPALLQVAYQWAHVAAAGFWVGGLAAVLLVVRDIAPEERHAAARRFSVVAGFAIAIVAVTGAVRAIAEVGTLGALVSTDYGRILVIKSVLIVVLASLGATNHFWSVPVAGEHFSRLRRVGITELTVSIAAIALTAALVDLVPPVSVGGTPGPGVRPVVVSGTDAATGTRVRLVVTPGAAGTNEFAAAVTGGAGTPVDVSGVSLHFELTSTPGAVASDRSLARTGTGSFTGTGGDLSIDGIWRVTAAVTTASGHVSVPLVVPTVVADEAVDVNTSPGVPTIHVVHLTGGLTAQIYLDPETAGKTEAHATFFDGAGTELPVQSATIAIAPAAGPGQILEGRQLEPGHFVADVELPAGPLVVDVVGPDPATGAPIHVHLSMTVQP
jgi:uncharacterized membrane protein